MEEDTKDDRKTAEIASLTDLLMHARQQLDATNAKLEALKKVVVAIPT